MINIQKSIVTFFVETLLILKVVSAFKKGSWFLETKI